MVSFNLKVRAGRREQLRQVFVAQRKEYREDNLPTNIAVFFEDMFSVLVAEEGEKAQYCDIEKLFADVLKEWRSSGLA